MILKSPELNAGAALVCIGVMLAIPTMKFTGLIGLDMTQYSSGVHTFLRLAFLLFTINFVNNAAKAGGRE